MITNEVYVEIEILRKHGMSLREIAREVGCAVNTVRSHLTADALPNYQRITLRHRFCLNPSGGGVTRLSRLAQLVCLDQ